MSDSCWVNASIQSLADDCTSYILTNVTDGNVSILEITDYISLIIESAQSGFGNFWKNYCWAKMCYNYRSGYTLYNTVRCNCALKSTVYHLSNWYNSWEFNICKFRLTVNYWSVVIVLKKNKPDNIYWSCYAVNLYFLIYIKYVLATTSNLTVLTLL